MFDFGDPELRSALGNQNIEDDINYWLAQPNDETQKPQQHRECKSDCGKSLKNFYTKKLVKISVLSDTYIGIDYTSWMSLCDLCKQSVMQWYFGEVFETDKNDRPSKELFELIIKEDNAAIDWDAAERDYGKMMIGYRENDDTIITKEELDEMKEYCEGHKWDWKDAYGRLQNLESKSTSNNGIKVTNQVTNQGVRRNND